MEIPNSEREHVFNVNKTALAGVGPGSKVFITSASSPLLGLLTRIEGVLSVNRNYVMTVSGRRFSVPTGRGLKELDLSCVACKLTPALRDAYKALVAFRRSTTWTALYNFSDLPVEIMAKITALVAQGEKQNTSLRRNFRHGEKPLRVALADQLDYVECWKVEKDQEALKGFRLPPLTSEIILRRHRLRAVTTYGESFFLAPSSGVTVAKLRRRVKRGFFSHFCDIERRAS